MFNVFATNDCLSSVVYLLKNKSKLAIHKQFKVKVYDMLTMHETQFETFQCDSLTRFKYYLKSHLLTVFPIKMGIVNSEQQDKLVNLAIEKAAKHGLNTIATVQVYADQMLILGACWDEDPIYSTISDHLSNQSISAIARMDFVHADTLKWSTNVIADNTNPGYFTRALENANFICNSNLGTPVTSESILALFKQTYPQKFEHAAQASMQKLIEQTVDSTQRFGNTSKDDTYYALMATWLWGIGCFEDPLLLEEASSDDISLQVQKLIEYFLSNFAKRAQR